MECDVRMVESVWMVSGRLSPVSVSRAGLDRTVRSDWSSIIGPDQYRYSPLIGGNLTMLVPQSILYTITIHPKASESAQCQHYVPFGVLLWHDKVIMHGNTIEGFQPPHPQLREN